jgi:hypothetical protein
MRAPGSKMLIGSTAPSVEESAFPETRRVARRGHSFSCCERTEHGGLKGDSRLRHRETAAIPRNPEQCVVTFCGNSGSLICKWLMEKMERAKGFESW